jgi:hypothetical protein
MADRDGKTSRGTQRGTASRDVVATFTHKQTNTRTMARRGNATRQHAARTKQLQLQAASIALGLGIRFRKKEKWLKKERRRDRVKIKDV